MFPLLTYLTKGHTFIIKEETMHIRPWAVRKSQYERAFINVETQKM